MYKYSISMYDWEKPLNVLMKKVYNYASLQLHSNVDDICTATALTWEEGIVTKPQVYLQ